MDFPFEKNPAPGTQVMLEGKVWEFKVTSPPGNTPRFPGQPLGHWNVSNVIVATENTFAAGDVLTLDTEVTQGDPGGADPTEQVTNITYSFDMETIAEQD